MQTRAADDADEIWPQLMRLRRICFANDKIKLPTEKCWCRGAKADGGDISCTEARDPTPFDLLGRPAPL